MSVKSQDEPQKNLRCPPEAPQGSSLEKPLAQYPVGLRFLIEDIGMRGILPRRYNKRVLRDDSIEIRIATVGCPSS
jgi:hypothetical protein